MPAPLFHSANADRARFMAVYIGIVVGLLVAAGLFLYEARITVADDLHDEEAFAVLGTANGVLHDLENAETGQRGYLLTGNESYLVPYRQGISDLDHTVLRLQQAVGDDAQSAELVRRIGYAKTDKVTELAHTIELARSGHRDAAIALVQTDEGKRDMDTLRDDIGQLLDRWQQRRAVATQDAHQRIIFGTAALGLIAALICCLMVYALIVQRRAFAKIHAWSEVLGHQAAHDPLTGLPNRRRLLSVIGALDTRSSTGPRRIALLYLDVDGFKKINDALGHSAGDALLCRLAQSLRAATRESDLLARVGGDEFVLVAADCGNDGQLCELAGRLIACVQNVGEGEYDGRFPLGVSIGIATFPDRAKATEELLDLADSAMYAAKRAGRSTCRFGASSDVDLSNVVELAREDTSRDDPDA